MNESKCDSHIQSSATSHVVTSRSFRLSGETNLLPEEMREDSLSGTTQLYLGVFEAQDRAQTISGTNSSELLLSQVSD